MSTSPATAPLTTVAGYLLTRLAEAGVISVFGVPGDYNLGILDAIENRKSMAWVGTATEQGAGYAADSYARLRGLGAFVTTFGAGELSAMNAVAGAYAESAPMVHIVGTPALAARAAGVTLHHNLPGTDFGRFARMAAEVTVAQADLRADTAPAEIDRVLRTALRTSRPVYLAIPADVAGPPVPGPAAPLRTDQSTEADPLVVNMFADRARQVSASAGSQAAGLTQRGLWARVRDFLLPGDLVVADQGTAFSDAAEVALPEATRMIGQPMWASAGWALPAALGASLAEPSRRVVLITGDGAMQQTAAELGTLLAQGLALVMIVISKGGYATERLIGPDDAPALPRDLTREVGGVRGGVLAELRLGRARGTGIRAGGRIPAGGGPAEADLCQISGAGA